MPAREQHALAERLKAAMAVMAPRLHDLREMDEWKRFANAAVQEELIAKAEALRAKYSLDGTTETKEDGTTEVTPAKPEDIEKAAHELHEIQERWKQVAEAPRAQAQALWHRYRQAADPIQAKAREFFAQRAEERGANLKRKLALIERAEALAESTDWIKTADELKKLQAEWQQIGPVPRQDTKVTWKRFRDACDRFFTRRNADLVGAQGNVDGEPREEGSALRPRRGAGGVTRVGQGRGRNPPAAGRVEDDRPGAPQQVRGDLAALPHRVRHVLRALQAPRRDRARSQARRSRSAGRRARGAGARRLPRAKARTCRRPGSDLLERVRSLRTRWNQTTPVVRQGADPLSARFIDALARLLTGHPDAFKGTELDVEASRQKMEKLCARVEGFLADAAPAPAGSQALADMLREALASNTIGGRAGEEAEVAGDGRRRPPGAGVVEPPRARARRSRPPAHRTVPQGVQPLLRAAAPQGAADSRSQHAAGDAVGAR